MLEPRPSVPELVAGPQRTSPPRRCGGRASATARLSQKQASSARSLDQTAVPTVIASRLWLLIGRGWSAKITVLLSKDAKMLRSHSWERRRTSHDLLALQIQVRDGQLGHLHMRNIVQSPLQVLLRMEDEHIILIYCDVSTLLAPHIGSEQID